MGTRTKTKLPALMPGWAEYLRTSDDDVQAPERSQGYQHRLIVDNLVEPSGLPLVATYADTMSGKKINRVHYQQLLADARLGKFSHVAIAFIDRFGRNDVEGLRAYDELRDLGIKVRVATYASLVPEKADARMIVGMLFNVAQFEVARTGERSREAMIETLNRGDWAFKAPDGYLNTEIKKSELEPAERLKHSKHKHAIATNPPRFAFWREAFDLLLTDKYTLAQICEQLHARGHRLGSGKPLVENDVRGKRQTAAKYLSAAFHNWFYAGWLVVDNDWITVPPKQIRGHWEPVVSTEEFERGLAILHQRNNNRTHQAQHFYLLQRLVYLEQADGSLVKLSCSTPNANRERGGVSYYCVGSTNLNFLCHQIDDQVARYMHHIGVEESRLPLIRKTYEADVDAYVRNPKVHERRRLEKALKDIGDAELFFARQYQAQQFSEENWLRMSREWREQRTQIQAQLQVITCDPGATIASLDDALTVISKAGILYSGLTPAGQQEVLRLMIEKVVISPQGQVIRMELRAPFGYLARLLTDNSETTPSKGKLRTNARNGKTKTSSGMSAGSSFVKFYAPNHIGNEPPFSLKLDHLFLFAELTAYPQRSALEPLLHDE